MNKTKFRKKRAARLLSCFYNEFYCVDYKYFITRYKFNIKVFTAYFNNNIDILLSYRTVFNDREKVEFDVKTFVLFHVVSLFNQLIFRHYSTQPAYFASVYSNSLILMTKSTKENIHHFCYSCDDKLILIPFCAHNKFIRIDMQTVLDQFK